MVSPNPSSASLIISCFSPCFFDVFSIFSSHSVFIPSSISVSIFFSSEYAESFFTEFFFSDIFTGRSCSFLENLFISQKDNIPRIIIPRTPHRKISVLTLGRYPVAIPMAAPSRTRTAAANPAAFFPISVFFSASSFDFFFFLFPAFFDFSASASESRSQFSISHNSSCSFSDVTSFCTDTVACFFSYASKSS